MKKTLLTVATMLAISTAHAKISDTDAVRAIYGEACGEPYTGKLALAGALRNRGTLRGVYGLNSPLLRRDINRRAWSDCVTAWAASRTNDISRGATCWGSKSDIAKASLYKRMTPTATIGGHTFFK